VEVCISTFQSFFPHVYYNYAHAVKLLKLHKLLYMLEGSTWLLFFHSCFSRI
jgi:hypothetical protein